MERALKVLLPAALILLVTAQTDYRSLPEIYQQLIDKALKEANGKFGKGYHVAFDSLKGTPSTMESNLYVNVLLKVTTCKKAHSDAYEHRAECYERKQNTPWIDCLVCKTKDNVEQVDCGTVREVQNNKRDELRNKCVTYRPGSFTGMLKSQDTAQIGCLGCI